MDPGRFDRRVTILRRPQTEGGVSRGPYVEAFRVWANYRPIGARELSQGGQAVNVESATLTVRSSRLTRTITSLDRISVDGRDFAVEGVQMHDRRTGLLVFGIATRLGGQ